MEIFYLDNIEQIKKLNNLKNKLYNIAKRSLSPFIRIKIIKTDNEYKIGTIEYFNKKTYKSLHNIELLNILK